MVLTNFHGHVNIESIHNVCLELSNKQQTESDKKEVEG